MDALKWQQPDQAKIKMTDLVKNCIETMGFNQLIRGPTRFWPNQTSSLIDQCWANCPEKVLTATNIRNGTSDHNLIEAVIKIKGKIGTPKEILKRKMKNWDNDIFRQRIESIDWTNMYTTSNLSAAYGIFERNILEKLDEMAPMVTIQLKNNFKNWVTQTTLDKMKLRDDCREVARNSQKPEDWNFYRTQRNICTAALRTDRKTYLRRTYEKMEQENDISSMHKMTRNLLGWLSGGTPDFYLLNGRRIGAAKEMANHQLSHFRDKIVRLQNEIPPQTENPHKFLISALERWGGRRHLRPKFKLREISLKETANLLGKLGNTRSFGHDRIDGMTLKVAAVSLLKPINYLINKSLSESDFANQWKVGKIVPLYKGKGSRNDPANYRPVVLLSVISKVVERAVQNQLLDYMNQTKQLNTNHHAYLKNHSTITAMMQLVDQIYQATDENLITTLMTVDESSAFDMVKHKLLLEKLELYNFSSETTKWFENYLKMRTVYVTVNAKSSRMVSIKEGVPQGSVLGPLLYTLFVNELPEIVKEIECNRHEHEKY